MYFATGYFKAKYFEADHLRVFVEGGEEPEAPDVFVWTPGELASKKRRKRVEEYALEEPATPAPVIPPPAKPKRKKKLPALPVADPAPIVTPPVAAPEPVATLPLVQPPAPKPEPEVMHEAPDWEALQAQAKAITDRIVEEREAEAARLKAEEEAHWEALVQEHLARLELRRYQLEDEPEEIMALLLAVMNP